MNVKNITYLFTTLIGLTSIVSPAYGAAVVAKPKESAQKASSWSFARSSIKSTDTQPLTSTAPPAHSPDASTDAKVADIHYPSIQPQTIRVAIATPCDVAASLEMLTIGTDEGKETKREQEFDAFVDVIKDRQDITLLHIKKLYDSIVASDVKSVLEVLDFGITNDNVMLWKDRSLVREHLSPIWLAFTVALQQKPSCNKALGRILITITRPQKIITIANAFVKDETSLAEFTSLPPDAQGLVKSCMILMLINFHGCTILPQPIGGYRSQHMYAIIDEAGHLPLAFFMRCAPRFDSDTLISDIKNIDIAKLLIAAGQSELSHFNPKIREALGHTEPKKDGCVIA